MIHGARNGSEGMGTRGWVFGPIRIGAQAQWVDSGMSLLWKMCHFSGRHGLSGPGLRTPGQGG